ncbi:unnamed protein product [marine sediment metagenome]|uniref:Uncharacterized protein n=1 Tax=marine sediment metagenome TaxID=412755 RepID=X1S1E7_9ZZZZ
MTSKGHALSRDALIRTLTAYSGITTADGAFDGTATLIDSNLIGRNDFIREKTILIMSGDAKDEDKGATDFDNTDGKITLQGTGFSHQIKAGTIFRVLNISSIEIDVARIEAKLDTVVTDADPKVMGRLQVAATTIDLQQAAATYDLFTGTTQDVVVEKLLIRLPNVNVSDDVTITSISIQTNDTTPQVFISAADGAKVNLTAEAQLGYTGVVMVKVGKKIQLTIAGGAADEATVCDVICEYRAKVSGGYLA